jgi:hypothetical protein
VPRQGPSPAALGQQVRREAVQRSSIEVGGLGQALLLAPGQQDSLQRIAVGVPEDLRREATSAAVGEVVLGQAVQRRWVRHRCIAATACDLKTI